MSIVTVYVGLDYHDEVVQVCIMNAEGRCLFNNGMPNDSLLIAAKVRQYGQPEALAVEACCGAADLAEELHRTVGWSVSLAHPGFVARMKQNPDKTDFGDAQLLADLLRVGYLPKVWLAPEEIRQLRRLVRHRQQLVDQRRNVKLRMRALLRENRLKYPGEATPWTKAWLQWVKETEGLHDDDRYIMDEHIEDIIHLTKRIRTVESRLRGHAENDAMIAKLMSFHSVGLITAVTIRAEIGRFDRFQNGKQLARYCGLSPRNASSGKRQADAGLIRAGNPQLRAVLIQLGQRLVWQVDSHWGELAGRLSRSGKPRNVVVAAVANRFMRWLYHQMQPEELAA